MGKPVVNNTMLQCSFGNAPSPMGVVMPGVAAEKGLMANTLDHIPFVNIKPFGMCSSLANPVVAAATTAASGVLTPMPCVPLTTTPWVPGVPMCKVRKMPAVDDTCSCMCNWAGQIKVSVPMAFITTVA